MAMRSYLPGSRKRKLKLRREEENNKLKDSLKKYLVSPELENSEVTVSDSLHESGNPESTVNNSLHDSGNPESTVKDSLHKSGNPESTVNDYLHEFGNRDIPEVTENESLQESSEVSVAKVRDSPYKDLDKIVSIFDPDPATWNIFDDSFIEYFVNNPPEQNMDLISKTERVISNKKRSLSKNCFYRVKKNNELVNREWLVLSPSTLSLYCWVCKLFNKTALTKTALSSSGLNDWKHVNERISEHENASYHRDAIISMSLRLQSQRRIDCKLVSEFNNETQYWREVLRRVVATIKFLSKRGLAFFGRNETIGSSQNGNFLGILELISEFDPFLAKHLNKYGNCGTGRANYLSSTTVNEFIDIMAQKVRNQIIEEIQISKYFSIIIDSTPDISHLDQLCFVIRYVANDNLPVERFLTFIPAYSHRAEYLFDVVKTCLENFNLDILNCRGQSYDNASNMSGKYSGLQARLKEINPYAEYVPCAAHSLNLVGSNAAEANLTVVKFFFLIQELYNFFSASTHRWQLVNQNIRENGAATLTLKSHSTTRWSADAEATKALRKNYKCICATLSELAGNENETSMTRKEAQSLHDKLNKKETVISIVVWDTILQRLNAANKIVQDTSVNLSKLPDLIQSLIDFMQFVRENFDDFEKEAQLMAPNVTEYTVSRKRTVPKNKWLDEKNTPGVIFTPRESFIFSCHYELCDNIITHLRRRKEPYSKLVKKFSSLINLQNVSIKEEAKVLQENYPNDLSEDFADELLHFKSVVAEKESVLEMFQHLKEYNLNSAFPNVETALRIFLTIPVSNCTGERSFSLLKRLKSSFRSTIEQNKLSSLSLLCMESDITDKLNYEDVITNFAEKKLRKKSIKK